MDKHKSLVWPEPGQLGACTRQRHQGLLATWRERSRVRRALAEILSTNPHLIDDMGMTEGEARAEITKRFWQA
jgi:uncharacterized protein YjiS (DUF1127 family)